MRIILFFTVALPLSGFSALQWIKRYISNRSAMNYQDRMRVEHAFGITDPDLELAWHRLFHGDGINRRLGYHLWKDILSEWGKLDVQRAVKFLAMIAGFWFLVSLALAIALALMVWL